jgi:dipeptidyl aminopeptidase/acylaminoacyl peptidase
VSHDIERLRATLSGQALPDAGGAEERGWRVVSAAFADATPRRRRGPVRRTAVVAVAIGLAVVAISPAGAEVRDFVGDALDVGSEPSQPALTSLPAAGDLLVDSPQGPWVVQADGSKRLLGDYREATWSPHGLFVAAAAGHELVALDPHGNVRWSLARPGPITTPRWSPDGFRIAYLSGPSLRIVAADGTGNRLLRAAVSPGVAPAWRPGPGHVIAFGDRDGRVQVADADSGRSLGRISGVLPLQVAWSADGRRLVVLTENELRSYSAGGELVSAQRITPVGRAVAISPSGDIAVIAQTDRPAESRVLTIDPTGRLRQLFAGPGAFGEIAWSPGGQYLLLSWPSADQWLFLDPDRPRRTVAVSNISRQFSPGGGPAGFPAVAGWCCAP